MLNNFLLSYNDKCESGLCGNDWYSIVLWEGLLWDGHNYIKGKAVTTILVGLTLYCIHLLVISH